MQSTALRIAITAVWLVAVAALGILTPVITAAGWLTIVGFGLMLFVFMLRD